MKRFAVLLAATCLFSPLNANAVEALPSRLPLANAAAAAAPNIATNENLTLYTGSNARWLVDRRLGVVSAWALDHNRPLWSSDGVVFRIFQRPNDVIADFTAASRTASPATEIFGRVYFFLPRPASRQAGSDDVLLVALDVRAQGRVVWTRHAKDFAPFFAPYSSNNAEPQFRFPLARVLPLSNDELLIQVQCNRETQNFALNAADGSPRLLPANSDAN